MNNHHSTISAIAAGLIGLSAVLIPSSRAVQAVEWSGQSLSSRPTAHISSLGPYSPSEAPAAQVTRPITWIVPNSVQPLELPDGTINIALLGVDTRPQFDYHNTDVIIIASINPDIPSVTMLSIPRDTLVYIPKHYVWRVNQAFAIGGIDLFKSTIEYNFGLKIDHYAMVNFSALVHAVDTLDRVDVVIPCPIYHVFPRDPYYVGPVVTTAPYTDTFTGEVWKTGTRVPTQTIDIRKPGVYSLDGMQSLAFVRARKGIPGGDVDRGRREQRMVRALFAKAKQFGLISKLPELLGNFQQDVQTDLSLPDLVGLAGSANVFSDGVIRSRFLDQGGANGALLSEAQIQAGGLTNQFWRDRRNYLQSVITVELNQHAQDRIPVELVNGTGDAGFAVAAADRLGELGLWVTSVRRSENSYARSVLIDHTKTKKNSAVPLLLRTFAIDPANVISDPQTGGPRYTIIAGADFNTCYLAPTLQAAGSEPIDTGGFTSGVDGLPEAVNVNHR